MNDSMLLESSDRVIAKAWADEEFKAALMADPKGALRSQGIEVPDDVVLNVFENSERVRRRRPLWRRRLWWRRLSLRRLRRLQLRRRFLSLLVRVSWFRMKN